MKGGAECPEPVPLEQKQSRQVWTEKQECHVTNTGEKQMILFREGPMHLCLLRKDFFPGVD